MANPLQPKVIKTLEQEYGAFTVNAMGSKAGLMDVVACVHGLFYGFEVKWKNDQPSELQKDKINQVIDSGGKAYFVRSIDQLRSIIDNDEQPVKYVLKNHFKL